MQPGSEYCALAVDAILFATLRRCLEKAGLEEKELLAHCRLSPFQIW